jgi:hypothetical protein
MLRTLLAVVLTLSSAAHAQAPRTASDPEARTRWLATVDEIQRWRDTEWPEDAIACALRWRRFVLLLVAAPAMPENGMRS